jgi:hypothetical protein
MKCDKVDFQFRGGDGTPGSGVARLLSNMTLSYEYGDGLNKTTVVADLGSLIRELALKVDDLSRRTKPVTRPTLDDLNRENGVSIMTAVPPVHVRDLKVRQWLQSMNVPFGVPVTVQFVDDLHSRFDRNPDATESFRRGEQVVRPLTAEQYDNCDCFSMGVHNCPVHKGR